MATVIFDPKQLSARQNYQLFTGTLVPRPIAWVGTFGTDGTRNLAPFSFFGAVTSTPLCLMVSVGRRQRGRKDTAVNLLENGECVVHIVHEPLAAVMVETSAEVGPEVDEFSLAGISSVDADVVRAPRCAEAPVAFECRLMNHLEIGGGPNDVFFLEVVLVHVADFLLGPDGVPMGDAWEAVGRLGANEYCTTAKLLRLDRPDDRRRP